MLAVVVHGWPEVPGLSVMGRPGASSFKGSFVDENFHTGWSQRSGVVVERTVKLRVGRKVRIYAG